MAGNYAEAGASDIECSAEARALSDVTNCATILANRVRAAAAGVVAGACRVRHVLEMP